jgi:hypothetical protein
MGRNFFWVGGFSRKKSLCVCSFGLFYSKAEKMTILSELAKNLIAICGDVRVIGCKTTEEEKVFVVGIPSDLVVGGFDHDLSVRSQEVVRETEDEMPFLIPGDFERD